jgi:hypothetical protein
VWLTPPSLTGRFPSIQSAQDYAHPRLGMPWATRLTSGSLLQVIFECSCRKGRYRLTNHGDHRAQKWGIELNKNLPNHAPHCDRDSSLSSSGSQFYHRYGSPVCHGPFNTMPPSRPSSVLRGLSPEARDEVDRLQGDFPELNPKTVAANLTAVEYQDIVQRGHIPRKVVANRQRYVRNIQIANGACPSNLSAPRLGCD